jgi:YVTN family beta-propeller protein
MIGLLLLQLVVSHGIISVAHAAGQPSEYLGPCALAVSNDTKTLYVACGDAHQVAWVGLPDGNVTRRVDLPAEPTGVVLTPDETKLILTCAAPKSTIAVLDSASGQMLATIPAGHTAMSPVISPDGTRLYVCNRFDHDVSVIDLAAGREVTRVPAVREPIAAAVTPDGRAVWVANHLPNTRTDRAFDGEVAPVVTVIDTRTHETAAIELPRGANGLRSVCISPDGKHALVTHMLSNFEEVPFRLETGWINVNVVSIIDARKRKVISTIGLDEYYLGAANPYGVAFTADGKSVCVTCAGTHELCVIETSGLLGEFAFRTMRPMMGVWPIYLSLGESLWRRNTLPGIGPRGLAVAGSKVYVAQYFSDSVAVADLHAGDKPSIRTIALGPSPQLTTERHGQLLFHDATICYQQWLSCASCHPDGRVDCLNWDLMNDGFGNSKNTKSMLLAYQTPPAMAKGVRASAELAVRAGLTHILFADRPEHEAAAIDAYLKSLRPVPSPHLIDGRLSPAAERGQVLFGAQGVGCQRCHPPPLYTDLKMHSVGTGSQDDRPERFDTPTLVEVWRTAPYLHDGRYTTIKELLVEGRHGLAHGRNSGLSDQQINDLVAFVLSL